ncbi:hypothetical protein GCM10009751_22270 [Myceligenerans crystallogenes]|uniref:Uncharacterized protein n=2 Tax=Myceligenerans crystallogenes TaxID=316335 RepID=A0ABN2ND20_9MICO
MSEEAEPTSSDLEAIEAEWPLLAAELSVVDAECRLLALPCEVTVRSHRRAVARLNAVVRLRREARRKSVPGRVPVVAVRLRSPFLAVVPTTPAAA